MILMSGAFYFTSEVDHGTNILDGNSDHVEHVWWKIGLFGEEEKNTICDYSRSN